MIDETKNSVEIVEDKRNISNLKRQFSLLETFSSGTLKVCSRKDYESSAPLISSSTISPQVSSIHSKGKSLNLSGVGPCQVRCKHCNFPITTRAISKPTAITHLASALLCAIGLGCGCCLIPYCLDVCHKVEHYCPKCNTLLGTCR